MIKSYCSLSKVLLFDDEVLLPSIIRSNSAPTSRLRSDSAAAAEADDVVAETEDDPEIEEVRGVLVAEEPPTTPEVPPPLPPTDFRLNKELKNVCNTPSPPGLFWELFIANAADAGLMPVRRSPLVPEVGVAFVERLGFE